MKISQISNNLEQKTILSNNLKIINLEMKKSINSFSRNNLILILSIFTFVIYKTYLIMD